MSRSTRFSPAQLRALDKLNTLAAKLRTDTFWPSVSFEQFYKKLGPSVSVVVYTGGCVSTGTMHTRRYLRTLSDFNQARAWLKGLSDDHA